MRMSNILKTSLLSLTIYSLINLFSIKIQAEIGDPNGSNNQPQTGWTLWQRWDKLIDANIDFGFSNTDLGAGLELQQLCFGEVDTSNAEKKQQEIYWWRLDNDINQIGSGKIQYGCWINGQFKATNTVTAYNTSLGNIPCLRVNPSVKNGLIIYEDSTTNSRPLGIVKSGQMIKGEFFPLMIFTTNDNLNWVAIKSPQEGWILTGKTGINENVSLCKN
ncbi:MAG: SH3 domain-containing protein [Microcystis sp. M040S2]|nr:SH3 domain-containing protein [Microcystis sp. M099S2]MCA2650132.1 SH3 domain-containing protein [Microcystis sp. M065S2]MCA2682246.1 SH3 domain-containing protein [Microcystis sp. M043S2]MCA2698345.1 SH3 domain-containing protein [Microcystis sp. M040S2]MCA2807700.1 SH3 domain-containing protein [Microcystis sp. M095S1]MCA2823857.1 SH3 domain-containing protein [Microcystis sp. M088S1]MCA2828995.1 SH3 domain-containing protein [Microcystis sp. M086S1]MCA2849938.1 SH3 domain-containing pr